MARLDLGTSGRARAAAGDGLSSEVRRKEGQALGCAIPTRTASIKGRAGVPRKSPSMMAAPWFSNTRDATRTRHQTTATKRNLGKAKRHAYLRLYHIPKMRKFPGTIGASRAPNRTLRAIKVSKFFENPVPIRTKPQSICTLAIVLAIGNFTSRAPPGKLDTR